MTTRWPIRPEALAGGSRKACKGCDGIECGHSGSSPQEFCRDGEGRAEYAGRHLLRRCGFSRPGSDRRLATGVSRGGDHPNNLTIFALINEKRILRSSTPTARANGDRKYCEQVLRMNCHMFSVGSSSARFGAAEAGDVRRHDEAARHMPPCLIYEGHSAPRATSAAMSASVGRSPYIANEGKQEGIGMLGRSLRVVGRCSRRERTAIAERQTVAAQPVRRRGSQLKGTVLV
jgi:hypothetical protein